MMQQTKPLLTNEHDNFSVIIPTYKEAKNISSLIARFANISFAVAAFEVIIVDDHSGDGIQDVIHDLQSSYPWLKLILRHDDKSLSKAVLAGFKHAQFPIVIVMDADLSHPPEKITQMLALLHAQTPVDMVIGSRYVQGSSIDARWPRSRKIASHFAALLARLVIGKNIRDPLSGFIALRKDKITAAQHLITPIGWKISLEMMVKCHCQNIQEIPIHFAERKVGVSKMSMKVLLQYLWHLKRLLFYRLFHSTKVSIK